MFYYNCHCSSAVCLSSTYFRLFKTAPWPTTGKELSSGLSACVILYSMPSFFFFFCNNNNNVISRRQHILHECQSNIWSSDTKIYMRLIITKMKIICSMYREGEVSAHRACCERAIKPYSLGVGSTIYPGSRPSSVTTCSPRMVHVTECLLTCSMLMVCICTSSQFHTDVLVYLVFPVWCLGQNVEFDIVS